MTAPVPRERQIATVIPFARNAYGASLYGPNGNLPQQMYEEFYLDITGTLTIAGGAIDGVMVEENPRTLVKSLEMKLTGSKLSDSYIEIPLNDLVALSFLDQRPKVAPLETPCAAGAVNVYTFRGVYKLPFLANDMANPYKFMFASGRYQQVEFRIKWGTEEDLIQGGDRTKAISACQAAIITREYSFDPRFELADKLLLNQRIQSKTIAIAAAQSNFDIEFQRTAAYLRAIYLKTMWVDANGVEVPSDSIIRATDPVTLLLNDTDRKFDYTREFLEFRMLDDYKARLPKGYYVLDISPRGDEDLIQKMNMLNFNTIKVRINNAAPAGPIAPSGAAPTPTIRCGLIKYAAA